MQQVKTIPQPETDYTLVMENLAFDYKTSVIGHSRILHADCFEWLSRVPENTIHAIVTDPPYGVKEYEFDQIEKRENGNGGLVRTLRGGDRPKNAEEEFSGVVSLPRGCYEPWGLFRKPLPPRMKVSECLREYQTGGLRRRPDGKPFSDVLPSGRTPTQEKKLADHPSLKPQAFLRQIVYASLPLGVGIIVDPFMGSGSTIAAAEAMGLHSIGVERYDDYYEMSRRTIPHLAELEIAAENMDKEESNYVDVA
jgi:DNA modification methylase